MQIFGINGCGAKKMGLFLFINDLPSAVTVKQHRFWQVSSVRRTLCLYPCKIQLETQIFLVFVSHFLLKQCHSVKFPTVAHAVNYHRKRYCFGARPLVLVGRENSVVYQCCLPVCLFVTNDHSVTNFQQIPH